MEWRAPNYRQTEEFYTFARQVRDGLMEIGDMGFEEAHLISEHYIVRLDIAVAEKADPKVIALELLRMMIEEANEPVDIPCW